MTHNRATITDLLDAAGHAPRRDLGQNYVADPNTVRRIARLARVGPGDRVVEIGAGMGSLTLALAETGADVTAVEVEPRVLPTLRTLTASLPNVRVVEADATTADWDAILDCPQGCAVPGWVLVANLPYNIATPLVLDLLDDVPHIRRMLVMVQREVAERLAAPPGSKTYGATSVKVAYWAEAKVVGTVPATVFVPRPNVESALIEIIRRPEPATDAPADTLFHLVRTAFGQRRKMLRRSLAGLVDEATFGAAGVAPTDRPESLGIHHWGRLTLAHLASLAARHASLAHHPGSPPASPPDPSTPEGRKR